MGTTAVVWNSRGRVRVQCASFDFAEADRVTLSAARRLLRTTRVAVTKTPAATTTPRVRAALALAPVVNSAGYVTCARVMLSMDACALGEYRYTVTHSDIRVDGAVAVYRTTDDIPLELVAEFVANLEIKDTDDPRARVVLDRFRLLSPLTQDEAQAQAKPDAVRAAVKRELGKMTVTFGDQKPFPLTSAKVTLRMGNDDVQLTQGESGAMVAVSAWVGTDPRVVAEFEVVYVDREPRASTYAVDYGGKEVSKGTVRVDARRAGETPKRSGALVVTCIDLSWRQRQAVNELMASLDAEPGQEGQYKDNYDCCTVAGASLGVVGSDDARYAASDVATHSRLYHDADADWLQTVFDQITMSANLHDIDRVVVIDHLGCSCYNEYYSEYPKYHGDGAGADADVREACIGHHFGNLMRCCELICKVYGQSGGTSAVSGYLLDERGDKVRLAGTEEVFWSESGRALDFALLQNFFKNIAAGALAEKNGTAEVAATAAILQKAYLAQSITYPFTPPPQLSLGVKLSLFRDKQKFLADVYIDTRASINKLGGVESAVRAIAKMTRIERQSAMNIVGKTMDETKKEDTRLLDATEAQLRSYLTDVSDNFQSTRAALYAQANQDIGAPWASDFHLNSNPIARRRLDNGIIWYQYTPLEWFSSYKPRPGEIAAATGGGVLQLARDVELKRPLN